MVKGRKWVLCISCCDQVWFIPRRCGSQAIDAIVTSHGPSNTVGTSIETAIIDVCFTSRSEWKNPIKTLEQRQMVKSWYTNLCKKRSPETLELTPSLPPPPKKNIEFTASIQPRCGEITPCDQEIAWFWRNLLAPGSWEQPRSEALGSWDSIA